VAEQQSLPALAAVALSLAADAGAAGAVTLLEDAGISSLLLKGASIAEWLYASDLRGYHDADLMVSPENHTAAEAALARAGYALRIRHLHASVWAAGDNPVTVDLHKRLWAVGASPSHVWRVLWGRSVTQSVGGREVRVLDPTARALVVALHQAHHAQLGQMTRRTSVDLQRALDLLEPFEWDAVDDLAHELRATLQLAGGLRSLRDPKASALADKLHLPDERLLATATAPDETVPLVGALVNFRIARGPRRKLRALRHEILPPADELRDRSALARSGGPGLALAYLLAPFISLAHLPEAIAHLRKSRQ
jgi:hypothetical protein